MNLALIGFGYLLGSLSFALIIGKVFYHVDIRELGSGNLGGSNAGRVLGKKAGVGVIVCDVLKVVLAVGLTAIYDRDISIWVGLAAAIGHCYPIFAKFHGGKAVATMFGFLLSTSLFTFHDFLYFMIPLFCFFFFLYLSKMVSLASIISALSSSFFISFMQYSKAIDIVIASWILSLLVIYRHKSNIIKIYHGEENKIHWM